MIIGLVWVHWMTELENFVCPKIKVVDLWTGDGWSVQLIDESVGEALTGQLMTKSLKLGAGYEFILVSARDGCFSIKSALNRISGPG